MNSYRCYFLDDQDRIQRAQELTTENLDEAIDAALGELAARPHQNSFELWQGPLMVYASRTELRRHQCHVYEGAPSKTLETMAAIASQKLQQNHRCLYLNSPTMVAGFRSYLASSGVDVEQQLAAGALELSSDQGHLASGRFDAQAMLAMLETAVDQALADGYAGLWASGDMSWELGPERDPGELLKYEWGLEEVFRRRRELSGVCQYHADTLPREMIKHGLAAHRCVLVNQTLWRLNSHFLPPDSDRTPDGALDAVVEELCEASSAADLS